MTANTDTKLRDKLEVTKAREMMKKSYEKENRKNTVPEPLISLLEKNDKRRTSSKVSKIRYKTKK